MIDENAAVRRPIRGAVRGVVASGLLTVLAVGCSEDAAGPGPMPSVAVAERNLSAHDEALTCSVGFWRNDLSEALWGPTGYDPTDLVGNVFTGAEPYETLTVAEGLALAGGPGLDGATAILLRAAIAALLNAAHPANDFELTPAEVLTEVDAALAGGNRKAMLRLADDLESLNDRPCALADGDPGDGLPDLVVSSIVPGDDGGVAFAYTVTVRNQGTGSVPSNAAVQGWYSEDAILGGGDAGACGTTMSIAGLAPGAEASIVISCSSFPSASHRYLIAEIDILDAVAESDEGNNVGFVAFPFPDLTITRISFGEITETRTPWTATVRNDGTAAVDLQGVAIQGWFSADLTLGDDAAACGALLATTSLLLNPGQEIDHTRNCGAVPQAEHEYLLVQIDVHDIVQEADESNNVGSLAIEN